MKAIFLSTIFISTISFSSAFAAEPTDPVSVDNFKDSSLEMLLQDQIADPAPQAEPEPSQPKITYDQNKFDYFLENQGKSIANDPVLAGAIMKQNERHRGLSQSEIIALDNKWRAGDQSLIEPTMDNVLSNRLKRYVKQYEGVFTEMFVMDNKGLNVGASFMTSDYWQGDEEKFTEAYKNGEGAVHVEPPEYDDSIGIVQIMTGLPVRHYLTGEVIGTIAMAINPEEIKR